jgi:hypothetical protein
MDSSDQRGRVIRGDPIDRHVERLDDLAAQIRPKPVDEPRRSFRERTGWRE